MPRARHLLPVGLAALVGACAGDGTLGPIESPTLNADLAAAVAELLAQQLNRKDDAPPHEQLSEREFQVFLKLAKGETAGDIAKALSLSVKTVSTYRTRLMEKMSLSSNSDLTYYALKNRLID